MVKIQAPWPRTGFGITRTNGKAYVVPGWYEVPLNTVLCDVTFSGEKPKPVKIKAPVNQETKEWIVTGRKGTQYKVTLKNDRWDCTCPARQFRRGECKHIKAKKVA